ncbi:putative prohead protease [Maritalea myrionectae]|uniref:Putative prohead protease n=1 Tax=Maritalea myrionectae TaxID=454601 RepID=A0A2R4ME99_9HYPH|nr:HK97 family phage prohead protease [Maritalea myrionectae]AVX04332.1 putative prohead protease [Maritalea myrionectae]
MIRIETKDGQFNGEIGGVLELDTKAVNEDGQFEGYASTYGNVDSGGDIVRAGAFDESLRSRPASRVRMLWQHDTRSPIGTWVQMSSNQKGLFVRGQLLLSTQAGKETYEMMKAGAIDGLSIGYRVTDYEYDRDNDIRTITRAELLEVSVVTFAMNEMATVSAVKNAANIKTIREFETFLRDVGGFSHAQAKSIASGGFKSLEPRDEDGAMSADEISALSQLAEKMRA